MQIFLCKPDQGCQFGAFLLGRRRCHRRSRVDNLTISSGNAECNSSFLSFFLEQVGAGQRAGPVSTKEQRLWSTQVGLGQGLVSRRTRIRITGLTSPSWSSANASIASESTGLGRSRAQPGSAAASHATATASGKEERAFGILFSIPPKVRKEQFLESKFKTNSISIH